MLFERALLREIIDPHRVLLAISMEPSDPLLDFHRVPRQVEVDELVAELQVPSFRSAVGQSSAPP